MAKILIPPQLKDASGAYMKDTEHTNVTESVDPIISDISLDDLIGKGLTILYREIKHLMVSSVTGLNKDESASLVNYMKLFKELKKEEKTILGDLSEEELKKLSNQ